MTAVATLELDYRVPEERPTGSAHIPDQPLATFSTYQGGTTSVSPQGRGSRP